MSTRFMETQVTKRIAWNRVTDSDTGECNLIPSSDFVASDHAGCTVERLMGFGVRESAPGYLDCTEWEVFDTLAQAEARAKEIDAEYDEDEDLACDHEDGLCRKDIGKPCDSP